MANLVIVFGSGQVTGKKKGLFCFFQNSYKFDTFVTYAREYSGTVRIAENVEKSWIPFHRLKKNFDLNIGQDRLYGSLSMDECIKLFTELNINFSKLETKEISKLKKRY